jgi:hypothetical protein
MKRATYTRRVIALLVAVGALVVASSVAAVAAPPELEAFPVPDAGFTISLPTTWAAFDLTKEDQAAVEAGLKEAGAKQPAKLAAIVPTLLHAGGALFAIDPKRRKQLNANLSVVSGPILKRTLADFDKELRRPFKLVKAKRPQLTSVQVDGVDARRATGKLKYGSANVLFDQIVWIVGDKYYTFSLSVQPGSSGKQLDDAIVDSIDLA